MARNAAGTYALPAISLAVANQTASSTANNNFMNDVATELTDSLSRSGKGGMSADLDMNTHKISELSSATTSTDAATLSQAYVALIITASDESTALTTGTAKVTWRMPFAMTLLAGNSGIRASLTTAQSSGAIFTVDVNEGGTTILSTKLTIDNTEKTSTTAVTAPVLSDTSLADDALMTIDIDQVGAGDAAGLKVTLIGYKTT